MRTSVKRLVTIGVVGVMIGTGATAAYAVTGDEASPPTGVTTPGPPAEAPADCLEHFEDRQAVREEHRAERELNRQEHVGDMQRYRAGSGGLGRHGVGSRWTDAS